MKKIKFPIRKLAIGVVPLSVGLALTQPAILNKTIALASNVSAETGLQGNISSEQELNDRIKSNAQNLVLSNNINIKNTINISSAFNGKIHGNGYSLKLVTPNIDMVSVNGDNVTFDSVPLDGGDIGRPLAISNNAVGDRTDFLASRLFIMPNAFCTKQRIDNINLIAHRNCLIRAFR